MSIGKLLSLVALVGVVGLASIWYINRLPVQVPTDQAMPAVDDDQMAVEEETGADTNSDEALVGSQPTAAAPASSASVSNTTGAGATATTKEEEGVDDILAAFGDESESYDDSGVDSSFSGNLDEGI